MIKKFFIGATFCLIILSANLSVFSQDVEVLIKLESSEIFVSGKFLNSENLIEKNWSFVNNYADAENLGKRIENLKLFDDNGEAITTKKFADGEFVAEQKAKSFSYQINLTPDENTSANAHVSWVNEKHGLLMLNDVFPKFSDEEFDVKISLEVPKDWKIITNEKKSDEKTFIVQDLENAIFFVGKNFRNREIVVNKTIIHFTIVDEWKFADETAFQMAEEIMLEYAEMFGEIPLKKANIFYLPFPQDIGFDRWRAETRGKNVVILSSRRIANSFEEQRLHEQLRHEIFHLWIPNSVKLSGEYAWFYEGFAVYQALKSGVWLGQISFDDYLNTLEQANFLEKKREQKTSLIEDSKMRWNGEVSSVYAKGMLVAFLADVAILEKSRGKKDLKNVFREIYQKHKSVEKKDGNEAIVQALKEYKELAPIIEKYIEGTEKIGWAKYLEAFGIENVGNETNANLRVKVKVTSRQKALLKKLGYNRWRNFKQQKIITDVN